MLSGALDQVPRELLSVKEVGAMKMMLDQEFAKLDLPWSTWLFGTDQRTE